ncbi:ABC transporter ATP-binding protein [Rhodococcus oryzae]|uniref:ABC transporter ATP-binding protein n=1 Tax=Rhodococcus oryzae TaxID=2571143 RepID=UPI00371A4F04
MIELRKLTKRYRSRLAVDDLTFTVKPGQVTGFLGPNGAGKSTTMRMLLGLTAPTSGTALINGRPYAAFSFPLREVGALLDAGAVHEGRRAKDHLLALAVSNAISRRRVRDVLELTGLEAVGDRRIGEFSLGMKQRLGIAAAMLGDPPVLLLDEPINGLDPEGIHWTRELLKRLAAEGRAVFLSSHVMSEMELTADHLIVVGKGSLLADSPMDEFVRNHAHGEVLVQSPDADKLTHALTAAGGTVIAGNDGALTVTGLTTTDVAKTAAARELTVTGLTVRQSSLEQAYLEITNSSTEYRTAQEATL